MAATDSPRTRGGRHRSRSSESLDSADWRSKGSDIRDGHLLQDDDADNDRHLANGADVDRAPETNKISVDEGREVENEESSAGEISINGLKIDLAMLARQEMRRRNSPDVPIQRSDADRQPVQQSNQVAATQSATSGPEINGKRGSLGHEKGTTPATDGLPDHEEEGGPEDFTLNMGAWMNGDLTLRKKEKDQQIPDDFSESLQEPLSTSTPLPAMRSQVEDRSRLQTVKGSQAVSPEPSKSVDEGRFKALEQEVTRMRIDEGSRKLYQERLVQEIEELRRKNSELLTQASERVPLFAATATRLSSPSPSDTRPIQEEASERIETLENALKASHETVRQIRAEMNADKEAHALKVAELSKDLASARSELERQMLEKEELDRDLDESEKEAAEQDAVIAKMKDNAATADVEMNYLSDQLRETRRAVTTVEEENDRLSAQSTRQAENLTEVEQELQSKSRELQAAHTLIAKLRSEEPSAIDEEADSEKSEKITLQDYEKAIDDLVKRHDSALKSLQTKQANDTQAVAHEHELAVRRLQADLTAAQRSASATETELRSAIRALSGRLDKALASGRAASQEVEDLRRAAETATRDHESVNREMELRFTRVVEGREKEWRSRVKMLLRERDRMGKVLLNEWGRSEVGVGGGNGKEEGWRGQAYRYRYLDRNTTRS